eukprot:XP_011674574.1 PREDICTED: asialoglycoprotein receptor 2-like [Strongylocentrotus purpuratus]
MDFTFYILTFVISTQIYLSTGEACDVNQVEFDGSLYHFSRNPSDFYTSKVSCEDLGMHLVLIGSKLEQDFLVYNLPDNSSEYWIGLDSVTWQDGSNLTYNRFRGYFYDFDEGGTYFVMHIPFPTYWRDDIIDNKHNCICEKEGGEY